MEETPEVQVEVPTEKPEIIAEIKNQEDIQHPPQSSKKHTRPSSKFLEMLACLEVNIPLLKPLKDTPEYVKTMKELLLKRKTVKKEAAIPPIPTEEEKKKKEPAAYMPKPPYPQRLKADNKNKAPKKKPKEEKGATYDSVKFQ
ncbi:hypothetical protein PIB30_083214 [Stylosanthes scabra]|uniref:Uncharacterized protein n=1 Tax=Stylosanthes scabra TaxID=79078 RepID=A0ABU6SSF2_9FABA|nr:hypothetical protein [Stylosanthes scabra]